MKKVTMVQAQAAIKKYGGGPPVQRLGQFLMNELVPEETCSEVYHEECNITAVSKFVDRFVEEE